MHEEKWARQRTQRPPGCQYESRAAGARGFCGPLAQGPRIVRGFIFRPPSGGYRLWPLSRSHSLEASLWSRCARALENELPEQQFNTWVRPLQSIESEGELHLLAPNRFVVDWVRSNLLP